MNKTKPIFLLASSLFASSSLASIEDEGMLSKVFSVVSARVKFSYVLLLLDNALTFVRIFYIFISSVTQNNYFFSKHNRNNKKRRSLSKRLLQVFGVIGDDDSNVFVFLCQSPGPFSELFNKLTPSDGQQFSHFGNSVAISPRSEKIAVGAPRFMGGDYGASMGAAYLFDVLEVQEGNKFNEIRKLEPDHIIGALDYFGVSVSISDVDENGNGGVIVVGSYANYVDVFSSSDGTHEFTIRCDEDDGCASFGENIDTYGEKIAIAGYKDQSFKTFIYSSSDGTLLEILEDEQHIGITVPEISISDQLIVVSFSDKTFVYSNTFDYTLLATIDIDGTSVHAFEDQIAIGDSGFNNTGIAYIYSHNGTLTQTINGFTDSSFGSSISLVQDKIVVGANANDYNGVLSGAAYVFSSIDGELLNQVIPEDSKDWWDLFGYSVSASNTHMIVGSPYDKNGEEVRTGAAYVFDFDNL